MISGSHATTMGASGDTSCSAVSASATGLNGTFTPGYPRFGKQAQPAGAVDGIAPMHLRSPLGLGRGLFVGFLLFYFTLLHFF